MAVAPHVSRVAKDYAPHGYSIREEFIGSVTSKTGALDEPEFTNKIMGGNSGDIYIEEVKIIGYDQITVHAANYLTVSVISYEDNVANVVTHASINTTASGTDGIGVDRFYDVPITTPVVSGNPVRALAVAQTRNADDGNVNSKTVEVSVRYRRKA